MFGKAVLILLSVCFLQFAYCGKFNGAIFAYKQHLNELSLNLRLSIRDTAIQVKNTRIQLETSLAESRRILNQRINEIEVVIREAENSGSDVTQCLVEYNEAFNIIDVDAIGRCFPEEDFSTIYIALDTLRRLQGGIYRIPAGCLWGFRRSFQLENTDACIENAINEINEEINQQTTTIANNLELILEQTNHCKDETLKNLISTVNELLEHFNTCIAQA